MVLLNITDDFAIGCNKPVNDYAIAKVNASMVAKTYLETDLFDKRKLSERMSTCGNYLEFMRNLETSETHLVNGMFCQLRLCPMCAFRRSLKTFANISAIVLQPEYRELQWIFITLTIKNCTGDELSDTIDRIHSAFARMTSNKTTLFRQTYRGWYRSLEVTYNEEEDTYHPHLHVLACVDNDYFHSKRFMKTEDMVQHWKKFLNKAKKKDGSEYDEITYDPVCWIEAVYGNSKKEIAEVSKYTVKPVSYEDKPQVLETLTRALHRKRCTALGGIMKETSRRLKLEDAEDSVLDGNMSFREQLKSSPQWTTEVLKWNAGAKCYELQEQEKEQPVDINKLVESNLIN